MGTLYLFSPYSLQYLPAFRNPAGYLGISSKAFTDFAPLFFMVVVSFAINGNKIIVLCYLLVNLGGQLRRLRLQFQHDLFEDIDRIMLTSSFDEDQTISSPAVPHGCLPLRRTRQSVPLLPPVIVVEPSPLRSLAADYPIRMILQPSHSGIFHPLAVAHPALRAFQQFSRYSPLRYRKRGLCC